MPILAASSSVDLTVSADSTLTIQNPGGFIRIEYPIGTEVWEGGEAARKFDVPAGSVRLTTLTGSAFYEMTTDPVPSTLNASEVASTRALVSSGGIRVPASADTVIADYGVTALDIGRDPTLAGYSIGTTTLTHSATNERTRFSNYSRKCVMSSTAAEIRLATLPVGITADPADPAFSIAAYIETVPDEFLGAGNPNILITLSNTTGIGSNYSRWIFNATFLRQGWNLLTMRQSDTTSSDSSTANQGNLGIGQIHPADTGTGFNWSQDLRFCSVTFNNMNGQTVHLDQIRRPAKAVPVLVIGFDATSAFSTDNVLRAKVAPMFAEYGVKSYVTLTNIFDIVFSGSATWDRTVDLHNTWQWDAIPHTWNHGATTIGRNTTLSSLVFSADVGTATFPSAHEIPLGQRFRASIRGASISQANIVGDFTATTTTQATYTATGAGTGTATGTIALRTLLAEVLSTDTAENRRIALQEFKANADAMRGTGYARGVTYLAYPNNSVPQLDVIQFAADAAGVKLGRASRGGYCYVDEVGIDNPLHFGSYEMGSGTFATKTSFIAGKVTGAVTRGAHLHIFGHFILDDEDPANAAFFPVSADDPPGANGNPAPPAAGQSGTGGWWYLSQLRKLMRDTVGPLVRSGQLRVMSPSEYTAFMGYTR